MQKVHKILIHILFWMLFQGIYFGRQIFILSVEDQEIGFCFLIDEGTSFIVHLIHFYIFYFYVLPKFFEKKFRKLSVLVILGFLVVIFYLRAYTNVLLYYAYGITCNFPSCDTYLVQWLHIVNTLIITGLSALVYATISWVEDQKQKMELITKNKASELALLRSKINPHFLFNTLNNIYYLTSKKSDDAGEAVMRLSEMMRYMIKDADAEMVPLEKEIAYIQSFIDLQRLRLEKGKVIELNINGKIKGCQIAPMLLISFVENAFKHAVNDLSIKGIIINFNIDNNVLIFEVLNYYDPNQEKEEGGFGLKNVKRRLQLIYPNRFNLEIKNESTIRRFHIKLTIKL